LGQTKDMRIRLELEFNIVKLIKITKKIHDDLKRMLGGQVIDSRKHLYRHGFNSSRSTLQILGLSYLDVPSARLSKDRKPQKSFHMSVRTGKYLSPSPHLENQLEIRAPFKTLQNTVYLGL
jgi:hypothetical protein